MINDRVALVWTEMEYPKDANAREALRSALRQMLAMLGLDADKPFADCVSPGNTILLKPNLVSHENRRSTHMSLDELVTHPTLIRETLIICAESLRGYGTIIIGDAPIQWCKFEILRSKLGLDQILDEMRQRYTHISFALEDWRLTQLDILEGGAFRQRLVSKATPEELKDYRWVDLGQKSFLEDIIDYREGFRVTDYSPAPLKTHHARGKHEYLVREAVFQADLIINMPKLKTHKKAGMTGALKNVIGINGHKECLPHHIQGAFPDGGDNYSVSDKSMFSYEVLQDDFWEQTPYLSFSEQQKLYQLMQKRGGASRSENEGMWGGSWAGNETIWRTMLDLNIILYTLPNRRAKKILTIVDGIIAGEGDGPISPTPKPLGLLAGGENPAYVDAVLARLMGYNISRLPATYNAIYNTRSPFQATPLEEYYVHTETKGEPSTIAYYELPDYHFAKPAHWQRADRHYAPMPRNAGKKLSAISKIIRKAKSLWF